MKIPFLSLLVSGLCLLPVGCEHSSSEHEASDDADAHEHHHDGDMATVDLSSAQTQSVVLSFAAQLGQKEARCGQKYSGLGKSGSATLELSDLRFYVHDVRLVDQQGTEVPLTLTVDNKWQNQRVALLDFEDKSGACTGTTELNTVVRGTVLAGSNKWQGLRFRLGVPFALNHADVTKAESPLNLSSMFWSWQSGYKFLRLEGEVTGSAGLVVHLGSTGCQKDGTGAVTSCQSPNRPEVSLTGFDPSSSKIVLDVATLLAESDLAQTKGTECMSGPGNADCAPLFSALGLPYGSSPSVAQKTFRVGP